MNELFLSSLFLIAAGTALMALAFTTLGWISALLLRSAGAPLRHNLLLVAILFTLASPLLASLAYQNGWGGIIWKRPAPAMVATTPLPFEARWVPVRLPHPAFTADAAPVLAMDEPVERNAKVEALCVWLVRAAFLSWAAGALIGLIALGRDLIQIRRLQKKLNGCPVVDLTSGALPPSQWTPAASRAARMLGKPHIVTTPMAAVPMVIGIHRPVIALPEQAWEQWTPGQKEAVLLHESAHIERNDSLIALSVRLTRILFWWCLPLHGAALLMNRLREQICDDHVLFHQGHGRNLAQAMVHLVEQVSLSANRLRPQGLGMWDGCSSDLEVRLRNLLNSRRMAMTRMSLKATWVLIGFALVALPAGMALQIGAQEPAAPRPDGVKSPMDLPSPPLANPPAKSASQPGKAGTGELSSLTRMQKIGAACRAYAAAHQGQWPRNLTDLKPTLADWKEVTTHPEQKAFCAFHYIAPAKPNENPHATAVLVETRKGQPDPTGFTAFVDGHVEFNTPQVEVMVKLMEVAKPLPLNQEEPTETEKLRQESTSKQPPAFIRAVGSEERLRLALTQAQSDRTTNLLTTPRITVLENQTASVQVGDFIPKDPKNPGKTADHLSFAGFHLEVTPQLQQDQILLTVHSALSTRQLQKDGTSKKVEEFDLRWVAKAKSGQTVYLQVEPQKGKPHVYLFLTPTTQKLMPAQHQ